MDVWYYYEMQTILPKRLKKGDHVRLVSPASTPTREGVASEVRVLESLGLVVEYGKHMFDEYGYMAGTDADRLEDFNEALRDPSIRAIITTRGGKGAYRIANNVDFEALIRDPKLVVGFSEITYLHLAILKHCAITSVHGAAWDAAFSQGSMDSFIKAVTSIEPVVVRGTKQEPTHVLTTKGKASGRLIGGNQDAFATSLGWALPDLKGAILLLEATNMQLGHIDRQITMLTNAGVLKGIKGIVVGQYTDCGTASSWTAIDVLHDRLGMLGVPILGGLPIGHGTNPIAIPVGTKTELDADNGELRISPAVS